MNYSKYVLLFYWKDKYRVNKKFILKVIENIKKKITLFFSFAALAAFACYTTYTANNTNSLSNLALTNIEALADNGEIPGTNCTATMNAECCVCFGLHHMYAKPTVSGGACEHRTGCSHY